MCKHKSYIPLHGHTTYSVGDGVTRIDDLIERVKEIGSDAFGVTEHGNMSSFLKVYKAAIENKLKPILGCELYLNDEFFNNKEEFLKSKKKDKEENEEPETDVDDEYGHNKFSNNHFLVYAKNYDGLKNLIYLSNYGFENFYRKPLVSSEKIFEKLDNNNIVTTGCIQSKFNQLIINDKNKEALELLKQYKDKFGDDFYLEIQFNGLQQQDKVNEFYKKVSDKLNIKPVFALDYHYARKTDWYIQYLLYVIKGRNTVKSLPEEDWFYNVRTLYIKEIDEIYDYAKKNKFDINFLEKAIDSTFEIRDKVDIKIPLYTDKFPKFTSSEEESIKIFSEKIKLKWKEKLDNGLIPREKIKEYKERLKFEYDLIIEKKIVDYFLILDDMLTNFVYKSGGATGAGRGSAGSSLILFILDVTKIDPIKYNLIFERFLNPARQDPPDVDMDIDSITQKNVEDYFKEKYGLNKVCHIANFGKFGAKTVIKDLCRIFELDYMLSNRLTALFNTLKSDLPIDEELKKAREIAEKQKDYQLCSFIDKNKPIFVEIGSKFSGMVRNIGRHASGILISNKELNNSEIPIMRLKGDLITGIQEGGDEREVTELGYLKLDILGLITATINSDTIKLIEKKYEIKNIERDILISEYDDADVYKEFELGNCRDIFQFGSDNMITLIKKIKPNSIQELCAINALWRPALILAGGVDEYVENRGNKEIAKEKLDEMNKELWPILEETYGIPVYQEQIMFILQKIGGFSLAESDKGRKILKLLHKGNQEKNEDFNKMISTFKERAIKSGMKPNHVEDLLNKLASYSNYSFNKSHSFAYAINAYISMWLKVHYKKEYYATLLNYSSQDDMTWFVKQAKNNGVKFEKLLLGKTKNIFTVDYKNDIIQYGLSSIKGVKTADIEKINNVDKLTDIDALSKFIIEEKIGKKTIETLCRLNYFSEIHENSKYLETYLLELKSIKSKKKFEEKKKEIEESIKDIKDWDDSKKYEYEKEYLGFYFRDHPFTVYYDAIDDKNLFKKFIFPKDIDDNDEYIGIKLVGIVNDIEMKKSKKSGKEYYKMIIEDDIKQLYVTIWESEAVKDLNKGSFIIVQVSKNTFGFSKDRHSKITKLV